MTAPQSSRTDVGTPARADPFVVLPAAGGLELHLMPTRKYRTVLLTCAFERSLDDQRSARAVLPDLLLRGTARSPGLAEFTARCEELYATDLVGSVSGVGSRQVIRLGLETISDRDAGGEPLLEQATGLLAEALHEPPLRDGAFRPDHFEQERTNLVRAIASIADDKGLYAHRRLMETLHAGTPLALHPKGTVELAESLDEPATRRAWQDVVRRAPGRVFMVGDVDEERALRAVELLAGPVGSRGPREALAAPEAAPPVREGAPQDVVERQPLAQSKLVLGFRVPPDVAAGAAFPLFGIVFGGGSHSRLFKRVREAEQLAYDCSSAALVDSGSLVVHAGVDADKAGRARQLVLEELERLAQDGVGDEELELSRRAQRRRLVNLRDDPRAALGFRLNALMLGRPHVLEDALARLDSVTGADVAACAAATSLHSVFLLEGSGA